MVRKQLVAASTTSAVEVMFKLLLELSAECQTGCAAQTGDNKERDGEQTSTLTTVAFRQIEALHFYLRFSARKGRAEQRHTAPTVGYLGRKMQISKNCKKASNMRDSQTAARVREY